MDADANRTDVDAIAASWALRLDRGELDVDERDRLETWLAADARHLVALARAQAAWTDLDRIATLTRLHDRPVLKPQRTTWPRRAPWTGLIAGVIMTTFVSGAFAYSRLAGLQSTDFGEVRRIVLPDGSVAVLDASSSLQVRFRSGERRVVMRRGEASFEVAQSDPRPFVVEADNLELRGAHPNFAVAMQADAIDVTVADGNVEVARYAGRSAEKEMLGRDSHLVATASTPLAAVALSNADVARKLSWRDGLLMFDGESLADAVTRVNRYAPKPVIIDDTVLGQRTFVGAFRIGDSQSFAQAAAVAFHARLRTTDRALHLDRR